MSVLYYQLIFGHTMKESFVTEAMISLLFIVQVRIKEKKSAYLYKAAI